MAVASEMPDLLATAADAVASIEGVTYWYPETAAPALSGVDLAIEPGLTVVVGPSGGGKSTLLRLLDGLVPQFHGGRISGRVTVGGLDAFRTPIARLGRVAGLVFQDPESQSVYGTVEREVAFALENAGMPRPAMRERVDEVLAALGIDALRGRRLATLSGGERQRVQLAAVLALRPALVALDEPTSQLDPEGTATIVAACASLAASGTAVVVAEHRPEALVPAADAVLSVERGVVGAVAPEERTPRSGAPGSIAPLGSISTLGPISTLGSVAAVRAPAPAPRRRVTPHPSSEAWSLRDVSAAPTRGVAPAVEHVNLAGGAGEVVAIVGPNGTGKTTLLRTIAGLAAPTAGAAWRMPGRAAYLPQNPGALLHLPTVRAEVELTLRRGTESARGRGAAPAGRPFATADAALDAFGIAALAGRYPRDLSAGERQRAALAAVLAGSPPLALLDEPTRGMDAAARRRLVAAVQALADAGTAVVIATHDADLVAAVADRVVRLEGGAAREVPASARARGVG